MSEPSIDQKVAWANLQAARLAKEADEKYRESHPTRVASLFREPGSGTHMGLPDSDLVEETVVWLDRSFGPYPSKHRADYSPSEVAGMRRLWTALKEKP